MGCAMYGDISRVTFRPAKQFSRVLYQQGRVFLDADANEQAEILLDLQRGFVADLVGEHGTLMEDAFQIATTTIGGKDDFTIDSGQYYVDGIRCVCVSDPANPTSYLNQADYSGAIPKLPTKDYLVYLDVWERFVGVLEDDTIREPALGETDTTSRTRVVWQAKFSDDTTLVKLATDYLADTKKNPAVSGQNIRDTVERDEAVTLSVQLASAIASTDPCVMSPDARYRGLENQLYRVEIHEVQGRTITYKWSRDNGSVVFGVQGADKNGLHLVSLWRDSSRGLVKGSLVELLNDDLVLQGEHGTLASVTDIVPAQRLVKVDQDVSALSLAPSKHPLLRRWDGKGSVDLSAAAAWIPVEAGIEIQFGSTGSPRRGDYWLIPARSTTGRLDWTDGEARPPAGVRHHYAPLAVVTSGPARGLRNIVSVGKGVG